MKRFIYFTLALCSFLFVRAQSMPPEHSSYLTITYAEVGGHLQFSANNTVIWIECPLGTFEKLDQTMYNQEKASYTNNKLAGKTVRIYGEITDFDCDYSYFSSISIANNNKLSKLHCSSCNNLTTLHLEEATALEQLTVQNCLLLRNLDISGAPALKKLDCSKNELGSLDVSNHPSLTELYCHTALISHLNIENATALEVLYCHINPFQTLETSSLEKLRVLYCMKTNLEHLDLSHNPALMFLNCSNSFKRIKSLNVANGNNANFKRYKYFTYAFAAVGNRIEYIHIDEGFTPPTTGYDRWMKDSSSKWKETPFSGVEVESVSSDVRVFSSERRIHLENLRPNSTVKVSDVSGKQMGNYWITGSSASLPISQGLYLVQIENQIFKVAVK